jgi:hypothetical protein
MKGRIWSGTWSKGTKNAINAPFQRNPGQEKSLTGPPDSTGECNTNVTAQNLVWRTKAQTLHRHRVNLTHYLIKLPFFSQSPVMLFRKKSSHMVVITL